MNILVVASKFPPEYSGPGVRIPRLYKAIGSDIGATDIKVLCGGMEYTDNAVYEHEGFRVQRVVPTWLRKNSFLLSCLGGKIYGALLHFAENVTGLLALRNYQNVDLFHILGTSGLTASALYHARKNGIPVLQELVTAKAEPCQRFLAFGKACPPEKSIIVTMQGEAKQRTLDSGYSTQVWHRPNPINDASCRIPSDYEKAQLRKKLTRFSDGDIVITTVAKIIPQKNQIFLLDVLRLLNKRHKLVIAGPIVKEGLLMERDQKYLEGIYGKIHEYGLEDSVQIIPDYVNAHDFMKASDVYALPAYDEGFGTPMMEALACGVPVIANSGERCFSEWLAGFENGFACPLEPAAWAAAIEESVRTDPAVNQSSARRVHDIAGQNVIYRDYINHIKSLVSP